MKTIVCMALTCIFPALLHAQTRLSPGTPVLIRGTDQDCMLALDGESLGILRSDAVRRLTLSKGEHFVECTAHRVVPMESFASFVVKAEGQQLVFLGRLSAKSYQTRHSGSCRGQDHGSGRTFGDDVRQR